MARTAPGNARSAMAASMMRSTSASPSARKPTCSGDAAGRGLGGPAAAAQKLNKQFEDAASLAKLITELEKRMRTAAKTLEFEEAARIRDRIKELRRQQIFKT